MGKSVSQRLKAMHADIEEHFTRQQGQFYLGKLYSQLDEIIKDAEEQEKAYSAMCQLYVAKITPIANDTGDIIKVIVEYMPEDELKKGANKNGK